MTDVVKDWCLALIEAIVVAIILFFVSWPVNIDGISMEDTFHSGDKVCMSKVLVYMKMITNGDIIVCDSDNYDKEKKIIKRVIAVEGDLLEINEGIVSVNGEVLDEVYAKGYTSGSQSLTIPEGFVFVLGDNREFSIDSRVLGLISYSHIHGKVLFRFFPFSDVQTF